ncbi:chemotaxis protein CheW [Magnetococcus sp. PR-3]|uniref:chemotaxis protein CheW n=1 Tax=Magnetococcus sp. PR-3 TaxID=3120355 RepID=UPI002FCE0FF0
MPDSIEQQRGEPAPLAPATLQNMLAFQAGAVRLVLPLTQVDRVLFLPALVPTPNSAPWLVGMMHVGHEALPVIDLSLRMGFQPTRHYHVDTQLILCRDGQLCGAFLVDDILGLCRPSPLSSDRMAQEPLIAQLLEDDQGPLMMLDLGKSLELTPHLQPVEAFVLPGEKA